MTITCAEVVPELWEYLDGELEPAWAARISDHLSTCASCYPRYRYEHAFLGALARQRGLAPAPSPALVEQVAAAILSHMPTRGPARARARAGERRQSGERWALAVLRVLVATFLLISSIPKLFGPLPAVVMSPHLWAAAAVFELTLSLVVCVGLWRRWTYGTTLAVHVGSMLVFWNALSDPWAAVVAGLPACGALITLYVLRDRDYFTLDTWLAWRAAR